MPRDTTRDYRLDDLARDAGALSRIATAMVGLQSLIRHEAAQAGDAATTEALIGLADALADTTHDAWAGVTEAHSAACDEYDHKPLYADEAAFCIAFRMPVKSEPAREELERALAEIVRPVGTQVAAE